MKAECSELSRLSNTQAVETRSSYECAHLRMGMDFKLMKMEKPLFTHL